MKSRVCVFLCMQGEFFFPAIEHIKGMGFDFLDIVSGAGIVRPLAEASQLFSVSPMVKFWHSCAKISVKTNDSRALVVVAHENCKGNPVPEKIQKNHLRCAGDTLKSFRLEVPIILLWGKEDKTFEAI